MLGNTALAAWLRRSRGEATPSDLRLVGRPARHPDLRRVIAELAALGIREHFRFIWSADGSGVEEEAPRLIHMHRPLVRARVPAHVRRVAERIFSVDLASVARHELGHALLFLRPAAARGRGFRALFGDVRAPYRVASPLGEVERRLLRHGGLANPRYRRVVSLYAATHPLEAFAEAFRIALVHGADEDALSRWARAHDTDERVAAQLVHAARFLRGWDRR